MRTFIRILLLYCLTLPLSATGQSSQVPVLVLKEFTVRFPTAQDVQWNTDDNGYKAVFKADKFNYEVKYNTNGSWKITQREIPFSQVPATVRNALSGGEFSGWNIHSAFILFLPGMITQYRVKISKNSNSKSLLFSREGNILNDNFTL